MSDANTTDHTDPTVETANTSSDDAIPPVVSTRGLTKRYKNHRVFEGVDIDIAPGAMTAVIGPNGTGKTTLLKTLLGHIEPTDGDVTYTGPDVDRPMGYLPQEPAFRPQFTVAETIDFYASLVPGVVDTDALLAEVNLSDARDRRVAALSGGMRRLLAVAQAVVGDPPVVCCDEPASGLDPSMAQRVFGSLAGRAADGMAVVVTSHTLSLVEAYADHVIILHEGGVAATGSPAELCERFDAADLWDVYATVVEPAVTGSPGGSGGESPADLGDESPAAGGKS